MFNNNFGIEIEFTGITRAQAARIAAEHFGTTTYGEAAKDSRGRTWAFKFDGSIPCQRRQNGRKISADSDYSVELVSPILKYRDDIETLQELVRKLRAAGAFTNGRCGIHIHLDGANHTPRSIRNFVNIIASKNDLFYKALQIDPERMQYCKKMDDYLVRRMNEAKPRTLAQIKNIWYNGSPSTQHYHSRRYHFLNLHSFFTRHHTVELRGFNSELHAGKIRSYIVLALALNHQALTQRSASSQRPQRENEKFAMRTYLNRIGFIGDEFKNCREHLCKHLSGSAAWRYRAG